MKLTENIHPREGLFKTSFRAVQNNSICKLSKFSLTFIGLLLVNFLTGQIVVHPETNMSPAVSGPEHGFLPGKKFIFYPTHKQYEFTGSRFRVELFDKRKNLNLKRINCSEVEITNSSEFADPSCIYIVRSYLDSLFRATGAVIDSTATDTLQFHFEALDARIISFGYSRVHGLCQMQATYRGIDKTYCVDITDADPHSPIGPNAFVTRRTATRVMASASLSEVIEQFFGDLHQLR